MQIGLKKQIRTFHVPARTGDIITPGKRYDFESGTYDNFGHIIDDNGDKQFIDVNGSSHLDGRAWDVITVWPLVDTGDKFQIGCIIGLGLIAIVSLVMAVVLE